MLRQLGICFLNTLALYVHELYGGGIIHIVLEIQGTLAKFSCSMTQAAISSSMHQCKEFCCS